jgi:hypothetical protein
MEVDTGHTKAEKDAFRPGRQSWKNTSIEAKPTPDYRSKKQQEKWLNPVAYAFGKPSLLHEFYLPAVTKKSAAPLEQAVPGFLISTKVWLRRSQAQRETCKVCSTSSAGSKPYSVSKALCGLPPSPEGNKALQRMAKKKTTIK